MAVPTVKRRKITEYLPDPANANRGTERGQAMLDRSVEQFGLARSIVAAADDTIPAGNKTLQAALDAGLEDVIEVETDGHALVVVKRTDWASVDTEQARRYAYSDNRSSEADLDWNAAQIVADMEAGIDLTDFWHEHELDEFEALAALEDGDVPEVGSAGSRIDTSEAVRLVLHMPAVDLLERAIAMTGERNRGEAVARICEYFLDGAGDAEG